MASGIDSLYDSKIGNVWQHFAQISEIPRPSKHEGKVRDHLVDIARKRSWAFRMDQTGNVVFTIPGCGSLAKAPILILQGHMDMVCEKNNNTVHDFMKDPILLKTDGSWVMANGTTLGADNGIALALMLALAELDLPDRIPLELLFTVDEETGLTGAINLDNSLLTGRTLLNLDSEDDRVLTIGCAGGRDMKIYFPYEKVDVASTSPRHIVHIQRLRGGHSGVNIHEGRTNAIIFAAKILEKMNTFSPKPTLLEFKGGNKKNAIPREAEFSLTHCDRVKLETITSDMLRDLRETEKEAEIVIRSQETSGSERGIPMSVVEFLLSVPNGVIAMDPNFPNLVQTSSSVGVIGPQQGGLEVLVHSRSSARDALSDLEKKIEAIATQNRGEFSLGASYPGWNPNPKSNLLKRSRMTYKKLFNQEPTVVSMHAGLETGIIGSIIGTEELLSVGPTIKDAHSPTERVSIKSVEMIYEFLKNLVSDTAGFHLIAL